MGKNILLHVTGSISCYKAWVFVFTILINRYMELIIIKHLPALLMAAYVIIRLVSLFVQYFRTLKTEDRSASDL